MRDEDDPEKAQPDPTSTTCSILNLLDPHPNPLPNQATVLVPTGKFALNEADEEAGTPAFVGEDEGYEPKARSPSPSAASSPSPSPKAILTLNLTLALALTLTP